MAPRHLAHLSAEGQVLVPAFHLGIVELAHIVYKRIDVYVLIAELSESVSSGFVLDDSTEVQRVTVVAHRAIGDGRSAIVHIGDASVVGCVRNNDDECPVEVLLVDGRRLAGIFEYLVVVALAIPPSESRTAFGGSVELVVYYRVDSSDAGFR